MLVINHLQSLGDLVPQRKTSELVATFIVVFYVLSR